MKKSMLMVAAFIASCSLGASAQEIKPDFEGRGASAQEISLKETVQAQAPEVITEGIRPVAPSSRGYANSNVCETFVFDSRDGETVRRATYLSTTFHWRECDEYHYCQDNSQDESTYVDLTIGPRQLQANEEERIEVCYNFPKGKPSFRILKSPFKYTSRERGTGSYFLELTPVDRLPKAVASLREFSVSALGSKSGEIGRYSPQWDENGMGFIPCKEQDLTWQSTDTESKIMKREGNDIYVCDFSVTWDFRWTGCRESNPHTSPGWCACKAKGSKGTPQNTGRCAWEARE